MGSKFCGGERKIEEEELICVIERLVTSFYAAEVFEEDIETMEKSKSMAVKDKIEAIIGKYLNPSSLSKQEKKFQIMFATELKETAESVEELFVLLLPLIDKGLKKRYFSRIAEYLRLTELVKPGFSNRLERFIYFHTIILNEVAREANILSFEEKEELNQKYNLNKIQDKAWKTRSLFRKADSEERKIELAQFLLDFRAIRMEF